MEHYRVNQDSVEVDCTNGACLRLEPVRNHIIRCIYTKERPKEYASLIVEKEHFEHQLISVIEEKDKLLMISGKLKLIIDPAEGSVSFFEAETNRILLQEGKKELSKIDVLRYTTGDEQPIIERVKTVDGERNFIKNLREVKDHEAYRGKYHFIWQDENGVEEGIYGLGQAEEGIYNYRHHSQYLYQHNMRIPMPVLYSDRGYGLLFDCCSLMTFEDGQNGSYLFMDAVPQMEYYLIAGQTPDQVIDGLRFLTGKAAMLPKWAYGYVQSKEQYYTATELRDVVKKYRELQVPLDCVVQDWNTWKPGQWGEKQVDPDRYGDLKERMQEINDMHAHAMVSVWPNMNTGGANHTELFEAGYMLNDYSTYNAFDERARAMYWKQAKEELFDGGFESWWCDSTEPFSGPDWGGEAKREPWERFTMVGNEHKKYLPQEQANAYALQHAKGIYENQRQTTEQIRVLNLTRSGYASGQRYGAMLWSGDTTASWETLQTQITEGLNMGLSGYPYWTLDIGGFFTVGKKWENRGCSCNQDSSPKWFWQGRYDEGIKDRGYCELYVRWLQMGTFLPMFRSHGTDTPREIWNFGKSGEPFYDAIEKFIKLRYQLMPYIYSMAGEVVFHNETMMRSLLFDFGSDHRAKNISDEFMFGRSLLICPVTKPMYYEAEDTVLKQTDKTRQCYLPEGTVWYDFWTGQSYHGGQTVSADAPLDRIPVYVRSGSIIPMKQGMQYTDDSADGWLELHIYPGEDGAFTLYEDTGNDYSYEKGAFALTSFQWDNLNKKLQISKREGAYEGMSATVPMRVILKGTDTKEIVYTGETIEIKWA